MLKIVPDSNKDWNGEWKKADAIAKEIGLNKDELREFEKVLANKRSQQAAEAGKEYAMPKGESLVKSIDFDAEEKRINDVLTNQDKNGTSTEVKTTEKESDKYTPIKPENMTKEQLDAFKEMSREYMEGMEYSAKKYQQQNQRPTKVVVTKTDPYTGAPTAAKVTYIDNNGHEQDTGYFFKDLSEDATPDNLQRRIDNNKKEKKVQHSDPRAAFYAAVDDYKSKKGLNQRVPQ